MNTLVLLLSKLPPDVDGISDQEREQAWHDLYAVSAERLLRHAVRMLGQAAAAQDVVHDVFVRCQNVRARFNGRQKVMRWLTMITLKHEHGRGYTVALPMAV